MRNKGAFGGLAWPDDGELELLVVHLQDMLSAALLIRHSGGMDDLDRPRVRAMSSGHLLVELSHRAVDVHVAELLSALSRSLERPLKRPAFRRLGPRKRLLDSVSAAYSS